MKSSVHIMHALSALPNYSSDIVLKRKQLSLDNFGIQFCDSSQFHNE